MHPCQPLTPRPARPGERGRTGRTSARASLLTPMGFFGFILLPVWLFVTGFWLTFRDSAARGAGEVAEKAPGPDLEPRLDA